MISSHKYTATVPLSTVSHNVFITPTVDCLKIIISKGLGIGIILGSVLGKEKPLLSLCFLFKKQTKKKNPVLVIASLIMLVLLVLHSEIASDLETVGC